jgi:hypothetical protein
MMWGWPGLSKKAHVFSDMRSLCGKWLFLSKEKTITEAPPATRGPDDCAACHKKLVAHFKVSKRVAKKEPQESSPLHREP